MWVMMVVILSLSHSQDEDYIVIKGGTNPPPTEKETKKAQSKKEETKEEISKLKEVTKETEECENYEIHTVYKCKTCLTYLSDDQRERHNKSHELEKVKVGERLKCQKCGRLFLGEFTHYCPICKGKLKRDTIEVEEITEGDKKFFVNKKTNKKVCAEEPADTQTKQEGLAEGSKERKK